MTPTRAKLEINLSHEQKAELAAIAERLQRSQTWVLLTAFRLQLTQLEELEGVACLEDDGAPGY